MEYYSFIKKAIKIKYCKKNGFFGLFDKKKEEAKFRKVGLAGAERLCLLTG
jgi:hypothetical protein